jgi:hypothetical protein
MIYFIQAQTSGATKIGWSRKPKERRAALQYHHHEVLVIIRTIDCPRWVEVWLHSQFEDLGLRSEWFAFDPRMLTITPPTEAPQPAMMTFRVSEGLRAAFITAAKDDGVTFTDWLIEAGREKLKRGKRSPNG